MPTQELADATIQHLTLLQDYEREKLKAKRFGLTAGIGTGVGGTVTQDWQVEWIPTVGFFVVWGWRL